MEKGGIAQGKIYTKRGKRGIVIPNKTDCKQKADELEKRYQETKDPALLWKKGYYWFVMVVKSKAMFELCLKLSNNTEENEKKAALKSLSDLTLFLCIPGFHARRDKNIKKKVQ